VAADIIPIQLGLTDGNVYTLWAPQWLEDGEEWEAFLGHGDDLYVFPSPAHLAAFIRSSDEHDLLDHPEWDTAAELLVDELRPDDDHVFDIVGVPDLVAEIPDIWTLASLTDTVNIVRSLSEVCGLEVVEEILESADGFAVLPMGQQAFVGRNGEKLWNEMGAVIAERWDEVIDAIDAIVKTPEIDADELTQTRAEAAAISAVDKTGETVEPEEEAERDEDLEFWDETGVDCLEITVGGRTGFTLRCYLGDDPVFLAENHRIRIYASAEDLELPDGGGCHAPAVDVGGLAGDPDRGHGRRCRGAGRTREHLPAGRTGRGAEGRPGGGGRQAARTRRRIADRRGTGTR
jgi:hypothetical protein